MEEKMDKLLALTVGLCVGAMAELGGYGPYLVVVVIILSVINITGFILWLLKI